MTISNPFKHNRNLNLRLTIKARACKRARQKGNLEGTSYTPRSAWSAKEWTLTLPRQLPLGELDSQRTPKSLGSDCRGQNPLVWRFLYIIGKLLNRRCLKCARITHLDIWNTSYGQKKGRESNWQFDFWPLKVRNW